MDIKKVVEMRLAHPFKPFRLLLDDGRKLLVDKPHYLGISPNRRHMIWSTLDGGWQRVDPKRIVDAILVVADRGRRKNRNGITRARRRP